MTSVWTREALGVVGAAAGGFLGVLAFGWFWRHGYYAMILPGAALGALGGAAAGRPSYVRGALMGVAALALGLFTEWRYSPFNADDSLGYFLAHLRDLTVVTWLMIGVGAALAAWMARDPIRRW